jgi:dephospho-CoA kinase
VIVLGLTGSIGMGKSATAELFREGGAPVFDADAAVAALYAPGGAAVGPVAAAFPGAVRGGQVDRARLSALLAKDPSGWMRLEALVHPLVAARRRDFLDQARAAGAAVAVLDIPLLFEVGAEREADAAVVVSAPPEIQRQRALARPGMSPEKLDAILARQIPDAEKRARADFVIDSAGGLDKARDQVRAILAAVSAPGWTGRQGRA